MNINIKNIVNIVTTLLRTLNTNDEGEASAHPVDMSFWILVIK